MTTLQQMNTDRGAFRALHDLRLGAAAAQAGKALEVLQHTIEAVSKPGAAENMIEWATVRATISDEVFRTAADAKAALLRQDGFNTSAFAVDVTVNGLCPATRHSKDADLKFLDMDGDCRADYVAICGTRPRRMDFLGEGALAGLVAQIHTDSVIRANYANVYLKQKFLEDAEGGLLELRPLRRGEVEVSGTWRSREFGNIAVDIVYADREFYVSPRLSRGVERVGFFVSESNAPALSTLFKSDSAPVVAAH